MPFICAIEATTRGVCSGLCVLALTLTAAVPGGAAETAVDVPRYQRPAGDVGADHDDAYLYRLPFPAAVSHAVLQGYGSPLSHRGPEHYTIDFAMDPDSPVHAARGGVVVLVEDGHDRSCWSAGCGRHANYVVVRHDDGTTGEYFHLAPGSAAVVPGERVARGQFLARAGNTGLSTSPHLHFGVYRALESGRTMSIPVRFTTRVGVVAELRSGRRYSNRADDQNAPNP